MTFYYIFIDLHILRFNKVLFTLNTHHQLKIKNLNILFKNYNKSCLLFILLISFYSNLFSQKSYLTPAGQFIKINEDQSWEYIEQPKLLEGVAISTTELMDYNDLLNKVYLEEAEYYSNYIILNFLLSQKDGIGKNDRDLEKELINRYKKAGNLIVSIRSLPDLENAERPSEFQKLNVAFQELFLSKKNEILTQPLEQIQDRTASKTETDAEINRRKEITANETKVNENSENYNQEISKASLPEKLQDKYDFEEDTRSYSEILKKAACQLVYNGFDESLNAHRKETVAGRIFSYTHPKLIRHFKNNGFLIGSGSMIKSNDKYYLNLEISIKSKDARRSYGRVEKDAMLRITLLSGKKIFLNNRISSEGKLESYTGYTVYNCFYGLENEDVEDLEKLEIDKIGIMWTTGFEEYPVYQIDFIQNQILCLKNEDQN